MIRRVPLAISFFAYRVLRIIDVARRRNCVICCEDVQKEMKELERARFPRVLPRGLVSQQPVVPHMSWPHESVGDDRVCEVLLLVQGVQTLECPIRAQKAGRPAERVQAGESELHESPARIQDAERASPARV